MVLGCTSGAGKSWLATALCRAYARRGYRVAPYKAQNMSNHARVVADGAGGEGEIGSAQYFQALAAGAAPDVRMNPVLLKPEADARSQVVLLGRVRADLSDRPWRERAPTLWDAAREAYESLRSDYDLIVVEGAGSPAEINLAASDFVNTATARLSGAACLLVADIDRGGAFAHLFGTHRLMDGKVRRQLRGFVLNRFRGDASLLAPGPEQLQAMTGVPTVGVVPLMRDHGLPEEDAVPASSAAGAGPHVVVIAGPHASNLDEFERLRAAGARLSFVRDAAMAVAADWLILPGSKQVRADLRWLKERGFADLIRGHVGERRPMLAICGGLQMLGEIIEDPAGLEGGAAGNCPGLGLLPLSTRIQPSKRLARVRARFAGLEGPWAALSGVEVDGYEIHLGETRALRSGPEPIRPVLAASSSDPPVGWQCGPILALYLHGLLENAAVLNALIRAVPGPAGVNFDAMADHVEKAFLPGVLDSLVEGGTQA
jgi:adenosylcobyric acid synthase